MTHPFPQKDKQARDNKLTPTQQASIYLKQEGTKEDKRENE
jgi:hypothetical protein